MTGKSFKGKTCAYCCVGGISDVGDHIFARKFFLEERRDNLPQVPACNKCNGVKSKLEHYLTAVFPFGGRHPDALQNLQIMVPSRLEKNQKLHRQLGAGISNELTKTTSGLFVPTTVIPFDGEKLEQLFEFIVKGLMWHHWQVLLDGDCGIQVATPGAVQKKQYELLFQCRANARLDEDLGQGTIKYAAAQGVDKPRVSVWKFSFYGGVHLADAPAFPGESLSAIYALTGPAAIVGNPMSERKELV
jgi:hypothetical protein